MERSTKIVFMTPGAGDPVLGIGHITFIDMLIYIDWGGGRNYEMLS